jgi:hypothetical protein
MLPVPDEQPARLTPASTAAAIPVSRVECKALKS